MPESGSGSPTPRTSSTGPAEAGDDAEGDARRYWANLPGPRLIDPGRRGRRTEPRHDRPRSATPRPTADRTAADPWPSGHAGRRQAAVAAGTARSARRCRECPIGEHATQAVPGEGLKQRAGCSSASSRATRRTCRAGRSSAAGQLLNRALEELGIDRRRRTSQRGQALQVRAARQAPHHKTPAQQEAAACLHWLESEIGLVRSQGLVALGATAARHLMGTAASP